MEKLHNKFAGKIICSLILVAVICCNTKVPVRAATIGYIVGDVEYVNFRQEPAGDKVMDENYEYIYLYPGQKLEILDMSNSAWYKVSVVVDDKEYKGYVSSQYISVSDEITEDIDEENDEELDSEQADSFEQKLINEGFSSSYRTMLMEIHKKYPNWEFKAVRTGISWDNLVSHEINKTGQIKNLIWTSSTYPHYNWRSTSVGYNWATDKWSPYDGTVWFAASDEIVEYYLDPRTYLYENYIFLFESLSYQQGVQNEQGVEAILKGTFMYNTVPKGESKTYAQIIMEAAKQSGVSPYHIASRMRQEMGINGSVAAFGNSPVYPGIYNFFNIGAVDTAGGSAVTKGLKWAATPGSYGRPWNSPSKAIICGSQYLGTAYISVGQDTLYTQKFNVTNTGNLFSHQYMTNVQAPSTECLTNYNAYKANNLLNSSMVFKIPVYTNMPDSPVTKPADSGNPNNWLKTLTIDGYGLTPTFSVCETKDYSLIVPEKIESIRISATTVNLHANVSGTGTISLKMGTNIVPITVTAQNGSVRKYTITVVRGKASAIVDDPEEPDNPDIVKGDLNGDGNISAIDIVKLQRIIVGLDKTNSDVMASGDINGDGTISAIDIVMIQRHIVGIQLIK